ncbi:MAG: TetR/AcrR family transcriptional regulator [Eubacterium sp.]|nr:TetR/AcrR family transcriptional regulator [Eubacterium sp.]
MGKMTKGEMTKEKILTSAKALFYDRGYEATTIQQIASHSGTTLGSMTYHFATKATFIERIFGDFFKNISAALREEQFERWNSFEQHFRLTLVYYQNLLSDPKTKRFYYEVFKNDVLALTLHHNISQLYLNFIEEYGLRIRPVEFEALITADFGARRECILSYCENRMTMPVEDFAIFLLTNTARMLGIPEREIYKVSYQSILFFRANDFSGVQLLK